MLTSLTNLKFSVISFNFQLIKTIKHYYIFLLVNLVIKSLFFKIVKLTTFLIFNELFSY